MLQSQQPGKCGGALVQNELVEVAPADAAALVRAAISKSKVMATCQATSAISPLKNLQNVRFTGKARKALWSPPPRATS